MKVAGLTVLLGLMVLSTAACSGLVEKVTGGDKLSGVASELWADVPPYSGAQRVALDMPLPLKLATDAWIKAALQGDLTMSMISYTTDATPAQVATFYTARRMQEAGWGEKQLDCEKQLAASGSIMCAFVRQEGGRDLGVFIVITSDAGSQQTQIFYLRGSNPTTATPTRSGAIIAVTLANA